MATIPCRFFRPAGLVGAMSAALLGCGGSDDSAPAPTVQVLSSKAEYVTGGDVLVAVKPAGSVADQPLQATLNGATLASAFKPDPANRVRSSA
jgi:hypothetical protein